MATTGLLVRGEEENSNLVGPDLQLRAFLLQSSPGSFGQVAAEVSCDTTVTAEEVHFICIQLLYL